MQPPRTSAAPPSIAIGQEPGRAFVRHLALGAAALAGAPLVVEAVALDPRHVREIGAPVEALPSLVLGAAVPYLAVALSCAALALAWTTPRTGRVAPRARVLPAVAALSFALVFALALARPSLDEVLRGAATARVDDDGDLEIGRGGAFALRLPLSPVPLAEAGDLALAAAGPSAHATHVVAWLHRFPHTADVPPVEVVGGGARVDATARARSLASGESGPLRVDLPRLEAGARVELRHVARATRGIVLFDGAQRGETRGFTLESGGGNHAHVADARDDGRVVHARAPLVVRGVQVDGGYTVLVLSGLRWARHDLRALVAGGGVLELDLAADAPFLARVVGAGAQGGDVALANLARAARPDPGVRLRSRLADLPWGDVAPSDVVGVALVHAGPPGPFELRLERAAFVPSSDDARGVGLLAVRTGVGERPPKALLTAGAPLAPHPLVEHQALLRFLVAALLLAALVGFGALRRSFWLRPLHTAAALACGPAAAVALDVWLPMVVVARPEHTAVVLLVAALGAALGATLRANGPTDADNDAVAPRAPDEPGAAAIGATSTHAGLDALRVFATLGVIGIHVTADPGGAPYPAYAADERLVPVLLRALCTPFDIAIFVAASFFLLAAAQERRPRPYGEQVARRLARLLVPLAAWSAVYLMFRFVKADAFSYAFALRAELSQASSWVRYALLGSAQYHLHFLPFLAGLTLLYPLYRIARGRLVVAAALLVALLLAWHQLDQSVYAADVGPTVRALLLRGTKTIGYVGFGVLAFALHRAGVDGRLDGRRAHLAVLALVIGTACLVPVVEHALLEADSGRWSTPSPLVHVARHGLMACAFVLFAVSDRVRWPRLFARAAPLTFGVYLAHPLFLDLLEVAERGVDWSPAARTLVNFAAVAVMAFCAVALAARVPSLRWWIGLERSS